MVISYVLYEKCSIIIMAIMLTSIGLWLRYQWMFNGIVLVIGKRKANAVCNTCSLQTKLELLLN
ncbi:hypothetical protein E2110_23235 [Escherichia coli]|nr:hypothetical protein [Escherichia coli]ELC95287.1 hypothetical protein A13W_02155 [Escherichia coli KTE193]ELI22403.1 hypothetical protein WIC_03409 [Escherichia coli KTE112]EQY03666.1 hypothetical protein G939_00358 [Escherichia coli UMEA 3201-1]EFB9789788.1 hypothetical protein [Escherichia coli]